jgi:hypothetical protein
MTTLIKKILKYIYSEFQNGAVAKSNMRKGFLIYEEMRKHLTIYEEAVSHIWLFNCSTHMRKIYFLFYQCSLRLGLYLLSKGAFSVPCTLYAPPILHSVFSLSISKSLYSVSLSSMNWDICPSSFSLILSSLHCHLRPSSTLLSTLSAPFYPLFYFYLPLS